MATTPKKTVLVVDDEPSILDILEKFLVKNGYSVLRSSNGAAAIEIIRNDTVDIVVSDIKMPGMSGVELLQKIREYNPTMPVLITTGFPTLDTAIEALKLGAYDYLTKPFHLQEIAEKIRRALLQRQLEEENILFSKLVSLHEVTKVLASTLDMTELQTRFLDYSMKIGKADGGSLVFVDKRKLNLGRSSEGGFSADFWVKLPFVLAAKWVIERQEPLIITVGGAALPDGLQPIPEQLESLVVFPLKTPSQIIGVLNLVRVPGRESFTNLDLELINVLASQASISLENVRLYHNIRENYLKTIRAFAVAVELKDRYTHGHSENVREYAVRIARRLKLPALEIERVQYAGLLHDIGKIGVSEAILNKPGKLTMDEYSEIKKHPEMGAKVIADVPFLESLVPLVLHHHEYFGGGGYPANLSGNDIPFGARILAVADAYEAMTSTRPYRNAMKPEDAITILENGKGMQFDPAIVDVFVAMIRSDFEQKQ